MRSMPVTSLHPCASCSALLVAYAMMESRRHKQAEHREGDEVDFLAVVDQAIALLRQRGRVTYRTLKRQFELDEAALEDLKVELVEGQRLAADEQGTVLVWTGEVAPSSPPAILPPPARAPRAYTPPHLAGKIFTTRH